MKKLNTTKKRFTESRYFQKKYGKLKYVSESGTLYMTSKGNIIQFTKQYARMMNEAFELFDNQLRKSRFITESDMNELDEVKSELKSDVKSPEDLKGFIDKHDKSLMDKIKDKYPLLKQAWEMLKKIVSIGWKGFKFLTENWKQVLIILLVASCFIFGWGNIAGWIIKAGWSAFTYAAKIICDKGVEIVSSGVEAYVDAGQKISDANLAAGGFGGWSGAGLGGGLR